MTNSQEIKPLISIAIATFNRAETLRRSLKSISSLTTGNLFRYEIVVVDNASTDHTAQVIQECQSETTVPIRRIFESKAGLPFARNRLVKEAQGEWIAFFDDDQLAESNWLLTLFKTATQHQVRCVGGARTLQIETPKPPKLNQFSRYLLGEIDLNQETDYHFKFLPCTGNVLIAKSVFEQIGTFNDEVIDGGEDTEFFYRMLCSGIRGVYQPAASVVHLIPATRLEKSYLTWIAFRYGLHYARRDVTLKGRWYAICLSLVRWIHCSVVTIPRMAFGWIRGRSFDVVAMQCKANLAYGYMQYLLNESRSPSMVQKTIHRGRG